MAEPDDYLRLTREDAVRQFRRLGERTPAAPGTRQEAFLPVETLLCVAASFVVDHRPFGSSSAARAPEPVPSLARLFRRPPTSVLAKMANLDGTRSHGARSDLVVGGRLRRDPAEFTALYRLLMVAAREAGVGRDQLPDVLGLETDGELVLLGQDELETSLIEADLEDRVVALTQGLESAAARETERALVTTVRVGQHVFASHVLGNCGHRCVFCGLGPPLSRAPRLLVASHIKPWRDSDHRERLDHRNGLAACPAHDVAFDGGLLTVHAEPDGALRITPAPHLAAAVERDPAAALLYGPPLLRAALLLPHGAEAPGEGYLRWHRERIFSA